MKRILFYDGIFHSGVSETDTFRFLEVTDGIITGTYQEKPGGVKYAKEISLGGKHVYPCMIDGHIHLLHTIAVMAMGFSISEIRENKVEPHNLAGVEKKIREYAAKQPKNAVIAAHNYILTAIDERRLPTKDELDDWAGGRPIVIYSIDGHSSALSTKMLIKLGIDPSQHDGLLSGEAHERVQGRLTDIIGSAVTLSLLAKGCADFQNACAGYGISVVGAVEGNGDSPKDPMTSLIVKLARHFDVGVRFYFQYFDLKRAQRFAKYQKHLRIGGCGDWEMDGSVGSHSAAFHVPYRDTGTIASCYYNQEDVYRVVKEADEKGYQIASHAIGEAAIERIIEALDKTTSGRMHRIEHCEFPSDKSLEDLKKLRYAVMMQLGYAWLDKRYLNTYIQYLPQEIIDHMYLKTLYDAGVCLCGSSDSPVQDLNPWLQMLGMVDFYNPGESITPYEAFRCYTINAARAIMEEDERGTLEAGKVADFFTADEDLFAMDPKDIIAFRPVCTYYGGRPYRRKKRNCCGAFMVIVEKGKACIKFSRSTFLAGIVFGNYCI